MYARAATTPPARRGSRGVTHRRAAAGQRDGQGRNRSGGRVTARHDRRPHGPWRRGDVPVDLTCDELLARADVLQQKTGLNLTPTVHRLRQEAGLIRDRLCF